jgi:hypothetical protein
VKVSSSRLSPVGSEDGYGSGNSVLRSGSFSKEGEMDPGIAAGQVDRISNAGQEDGLAID